jgi:hypothetical protein
MNTKHKPATALPWQKESPMQGIRGGEGSQHIYTAHASGNYKTREQDAAYIVHAANAYPKLVEALRHAIKEADGYCDDEHGHPANTLDAERALLRELGESE